MNELSIDENVILENEDNIEQISNEISNVMTNLNTILLDNASRENTITFKTGQFKKDLAKFGGKDLQKSMKSNRSKKSNRSSTRRKKRRKRKTCFYLTVVALIITIIAAGVLLYLIM